MPRRLLPALAALPLALPAAAQAPVEAELPEVVVAAPRAAEARQEIPTSLGSRETRVDRATIEALPGGGAQPLNQVLLQTPGVVQDSFGEIHIRGEHRNLQYRLNGVALPEGLSGFGQVFDARSLRSVSVLTGALPAQYGFRTNAVIELETRSGTRDPGGALGLQGGSRGTVQPYANWAGILGGWDVFASGTFLRSEQGIENPTSSWQAINGGTQQLRGLGYAARQLDDTTRLSLIAGTSLNRFNIPTQRGLEPKFTAYGVSDFDSSALRARQWERTWYGTAALQKSFGSVDLQVAPFIRSSSIHYVPSIPGEMVFNGVASDVYRGSLGAGLQTDATWRLAEEHTLRAGFQVTGERARFRSATTVLPLGADGLAFDDPLTLTDRFGRTGWLYGSYLQDEWRLTDRLTLNLGLRWDQMVEYVTAGQVSPRANLVWRATESTTVHAGYARTFTPPQFELVPNATLARFEGTTGAPANTLNDPVRPERAHRFDLGVSQRLGENLTLGADAYYKDVHDLLDFGQFGNALIFTPFNYRRGRIYGVEFSGNWRSERWLVYGNLALSRSAGRDIRSAQFTFDPEELAYISGKYVRTDHDQLVTGSAGAVWKGWEGGRLSASMLYGNGLRRGFANSEKLASYATFNVGVAQDFTGPDKGTWTVRLDLLNAFDTIYQLRDGTGIGVGAPQFGLRRTVLAGLSRAF
ncbi:TonB-dependent receptor [Paracraurococcus lichenis]|uniref:TonB-dependent receptor n=1 Tax=Paracraurococcus lichenis TaxID=3064888 RepID=A0ABT9DS63_9PROT|nr:TonB-dependent receptor [Paracraurococcus sp. LOR1-02]MDO9706735.1 TonB-dependent receptor [Paracraurococcus sp. LOR1-02]